MLKSIKWTLQVWHASLLALVLAGFGGATFLGIRQMRQARMDSELQGSLQTIVGSFKRTPRDGLFDRRFWRSDRGNDGAGRDGFGRDGGGPPDRDSGPPDRRGGENDGSGDGPRRDAAPGDGGPGRRDADGPPSDGRANDGRPGDGRPGDGRPGDGRGGEGPRGPGMLGPMPLHIPPDTKLAELALARFGDGQSQPFFVIWDNAGEVYKTSLADGSVPEALKQTMKSGRPLVEWGLLSRDGYREAIGAGPFGTRILVGMSTTREEADLQKLLLLLSAIGAGVMLLGLVGGRLLASRVLRPISAITRAAQDISAANLSQRIEVGETQSELGQLGAVLNDAFARLESAFAQQTRFTADASHELRTPLAVIHSNAQLALSRQRESAEYRQMFEKVLRASGRMKGLVDSLLLLARADAGKLPLDMAAMDLSGVVEECVDLVQPLAAGKSVVIETHLTPVEVKGDALRLAQVVTNLLTNAIRYNRQGGRVDVSLETAGGEAVLEIADTGIGIAPEQQEALFERFFRADEARNRDDGGAGLGLAICKSIVSAHGGTISCRSAVGKGTTFTVKLAQQPSAAGEGAAKSAAEGHRSHAVEAGDEAKRQNA